MLKTISSPFLRGLAVIIPIVLTIALIAWVFIWVDSLMKPFIATSLWIPGLGILTLSVISLLIGAAALWPRTRSLVDRAESSMQVIPGIKLIYCPIKEFADGLFGENRCFDKPVLVTLGGGLEAQVIGFVTRDDLAAFGIRDKVAVYFPQSYNFGGNLLILPRERLTALDAESSAVMSFIISGGVAGIDACASSALTSRTAQVRALRNARSSRVRLAG
ncbi:MAG TPA: DUF502 domain-containing protein [Planctomycetota bacterium]|nr:DUF502 domain-containing protein [Planctomycetota bacterium]